MKLYLVTVEIPNFDDTCQVETILTVAESEDVASELAVNKLDDFIIHDPVVELIDVVNGYKIKLEKE